MEPGPLSGKARGRTVAAALAVATLVVGWPLLLPWVYDSQDGHYALYNAAQFETALRDGQLPVRWLGDLFGGRGLPHFLYYHPLAFYLAGLMQLAGLGTIAAMKAVYLLSLSLSGWAMYAWLSRHLPHHACLVGSIAYMLAPFRVVEIHVKADPPAALAFVFLPLVLLGILRCVRGERYGTIILALASAGLVLSHSVTAYLAMPALALYALLQVRKPWMRPAARLAAGSAAGALLSAFHWLPAMAEKGLVHLDSPRGILFFDFHDHFLAPWQWLSPLWGYHGSFAGSSDDMSLQIGPVHAVGVAACLAVWKWWRGGAGREVRWAAPVTAGSMLMMLPLSLPLWETVPLLPLVQFPWRFLAVVALSSSVCLAVAASRMSGGRLLAFVAATPPVVTTVFAFATGNRWYFILAGCYAAAGAAAVILFRLRNKGPVTAAILCCLVLAATAAPWAAVPLQSKWKGEPEVIPLSEDDFQPERIRLGIRRTTARDDYLPRTVSEIPPRDPVQEYLPPPGAKPLPEWTAGSAGFDMRDLRRTSRIFRFRYDSEESSTVTLNLHAFPGWRGKIRPEGGDSFMPLAHDTDARGRIVLDLPPGPHEVEFRFGRTAPRLAGDLMTIAGAVLLAGLWAGGRLRGRGDAR